MSRNPFHGDDAPDDAPDDARDDACDDTPDDAPDDGDRAAAVLAAATAIVDAVGPAQTVFVPQRKRCNRALADLGLLPILGTDWLDIDTATGRVTFADLDRTRLDALVRRLEDLAGSAREEVVRPGPGQQSFVFPPSSPAAPSDRSAFHVEVRR